MPINVKRVGHVVIAGEWYPVELGTFTVEKLVLTDDAGAPMHSPNDVLAYHFLTTNRDEYYGPLSDIQLFKLIDI